MAKILIVDDDTALREVVRLALESSSYEVIEAADGKEGVELAFAQLPDLILCDVRMEQMDGYDTLSALRQSSVTASLPFILMTGQADQEGMRQGMELGADDYLPKPFKIDQLLGAVEARLRKQQTVREQAARQLADLRANICLSLPHELLTPLNGILGFADILSADAPVLKPTDVADMAGSIRESAERLHRLIQNFILLAHLQIHHDDPTPLLRDMRCEQLRREMEVLSRAKADGCGRGNDLQVGGDEVSVLTRGEYWSKIVEEIVDNAFKFSNPGTPVEVQLERRGGLAVFRVSDRGRGMRPEHIAEVGAYMQFERRFYEQQGSGLGLAIAKRLAELHGGRFSISSEVGMGTTVEVGLPAADPERSGRASEVSGLVLQ
jgi:signal transduction histidine kinase